MFNRRPRNASCLDASPDVGSPEPNTSISLLYARHPGRLPGVARSLHAAPAPDRAPRPSLLPVLQRSGMESEFRRERSWLARRSPAHPRCHPDRDILVFDPLGLR